MKKVFPLTLLLVIFIVSCAPATEPVPTPTPVGFIAPSVEVIDMFYRSINNAPTENDLFKSWDMLTNEAQCNSRYTCEFFNFQAKWRESKAAYKLYDCGTNRVIADETQYPRSESSPSSSATSRFWRYQLIETETGLMIQEIAITQAPGDDCTLVIEK